MAFTISADDPRTIRALEIAADADHWLRWRTDDGQPAYGIPSQSQADQYYVVTQSTCDCPDFRRNALAVAANDGADEQRACKHVLAVRLFTELVKAQRQQRPGPATPTQRRRGHLTLVSRE